MDGGYYFLSTLKLDLCQGFRREFSLTCDQKKEKKRKKQNKRHGSYY